MKTKIKIKSYLTRLSGLAILIALCTLGFGNAWGTTNTEAIVNSSLPTWLKVILIVVLAILFVGVVIKIAVSCKKNKSTTNVKGKDNSYVSASSTQADKSSVNNNSIKGDNALINNISGNGNAIGNRIVVNMPTFGKEQENREDENYKLDKQTIIKLFSNFSKRIIDKFIITGNDFNYIDRRVFDIRDAWYGIMNEGDFAIYDEETRKAIDDFYKPFDELVRKCAFCYEPYKGNRTLSKFSGLRLDEFQSEQARLNFEEIVNKTIALQPFYKAMLVFVKRKYKIDYDSLSEKFEKQYTNE